MPRIHGRLAVLCAGLALLVVGAYANHFQNGFHFDDVHTITENPFIQDVRNIPRFFVNAYLFSLQGRNATYRPVTAASLAVDYWLGQGYKPFFFHLSTFLWFLLLLALMVLLFRHIMDLADPHPSNLWTAILAAACYGLHPANAETVNYIVQRGDVYNTLGVVAGLALIFPFILLGYVWLFESDSATRRRDLVMAFGVAAAGAILTAFMTPPSFEAGAASPALYRFTQPWVALHCFKSFFLPTELSADTDWTYVSDAFSGEALAGYLFPALLLGAGWYASRRRETKPVAFGILWFFLALAPTSLMPLAEVTNDHRMFFPFVGLTLAVFWSLRLMLLRHRVLARGAVVALAAVMVAEAAGTRERNRVWSTEETLWRDVAVKSPHNARGLMNCGAAYNARGQYAEALPYLERADALLPAFYFIQINLAMAHGGLGHEAEAAQHYERAIALSPQVAEPYLYYALWLRSKGRTQEAREQFEATLRVNKMIMPARHVLMEMYANANDQSALQRMAAETLQLYPQDDVAPRFLELPQAAAPEQATPEILLHQSAECCRAGRFDECIVAAKQAIALKPDYPEAYNNIAAANIALHRWDEGMRAAREAIRIRPDFELAKKNLQRAETGAGR